jgi:hypothetical protein
VTLEHGDSGDGRGGQVAPLIGDSLEPTHRGGEDQWGALSTEACHGQK